METGDVGGHLLAGLLAYPHGNYWQRLDAALDILQRCRPEAAAHLARFAAQIGRPSSSELERLFESIPTQDQPGRAERHPLSALAEKVSRLDHLNVIAADEHLRDQIAPEATRLIDALRAAKNPYEHLLRAVMLSVAGRG
jgi:nitrate reductase assembly molybdenum cofactor insertion protein NarJ